MEGILVLTLEGGSGTRAGDGRSSPISSMLRTGERGVVKGDGERPSSEGGAFGRGWVPSKRASTSLRSSSSIASIDMAGFDMAGNDDSGSGSGSDSGREQCGGMLLRARGDGEEELP